MTDAFTFKLEGGFTSDTLINTPQGLKKISLLNNGDLVFAYNGQNVDKKKITNISVSEVKITDLVEVLFSIKSLKSVEHKNVICRHDQPFLGVDGTPIISSKLKPEQEIVQLFYSPDNNIETSFAKIHKSPSKIIKAISVHDIQAFPNITNNGDWILIYDVLVEDDYNIFFTNNIAALS